MAVFDLKVSQARAERRLRSAPVKLSSDEAVAAQGRLRMRDLPTELIEALFNVETDGEDATISAEVLAFYAFNYGAPRALSYASGLSLAALEAAERRPGWRPKSRALLQAVLRYRKHQWRS